jgi:protein TonB
MSAAKAETEPAAELVTGLRRDRTHMPAALIAAACAHTAVALALSTISVRRAVVPATPSVVDVDVAQSPPPPPPIAPAQPESPTNSLRAARRRPSIPPPRAAAAVAMQAQPADPVDLTDQFIVALSSTPANGSALADGSSADAIAAATVKGAHGALAGSGPVISSGPDRSRRLRLVGGSDWTCPFPHEADAAHIDLAIVTLKVDVDPVGRPDRVTVLQDAGHGFGREARRCALGRTWAYALDHQGRAIGSSVVINVRFER